MTTEKKGTKIVSQWKRKRWYNIIAPKIFKEQVIGETPCENPNSLKNRTVKVSLMTLTGDPKKQSYFVTFEIQNVQGLNAYTVVKNYFMTTSSIKRTIKRQRNRIDDSFVAFTKDNVRVRIKPLFVTKTQTNNSVETKIRLTAREIITKQLKNMTYDDIVSDIISSKFTRALKNHLDKIFPLKTCEIRFMGNEKAKLEQQKKEEEPIKKEKTEEKENKTEKKEE